MNHLFLLKRFSICCLLILLLTSNIQSQGLRNSHHDFHGAAWSGNEYCKPCHTPHNANTTVPNSPLWNHELSNATYNVYSSSTLTSVPGQPTGTSKLCLSCHDGTIAIDNFGGITGGTHFVNWGNLTSDLSDDHPVSILYTTSVAQLNGHLHDPSTTPSGLGGTIAEDLLDNGMLECTSCHDVHLKRNLNGCSSCHFIHNPPGSRIRSVSLWKSNNGSAFCLTCHDR
jgi:hypothetical protein